MALIDLDKFIASMIEAFPAFKEKGRIPCMYKEALEAQGLEYKDGEIVKNQRRVSAEFKESGYGEPEDERIRKAIHIYLDWLYGRNKDYQPKGDYSIKDMITWLEKQGEQNPIDKVGPKFHEGDWLYENELNNYARFIQILEIINIQGKERYRISRDIRNNEDIVEFGFLEKYYHKFDIKDAKDGDVLYCKSDCGVEFIVMSKGVNNRNNIDSYFRYNSDDGFGIDIPNVFSAKQDNITPATKEQRDLLFSKMKESGYEWDTEKKELKLLITNGGDFSETENCGQKPVEWKQENREELTEFENAMMHIGGSFFGENAGLDPNDTATIKEQAELLLELAPKIEWSEEDEKQLNDIIELLPGLPNRHNWLKSLKERNTWKPSNVQMQVLKEACGKSWEPDGLDPLYMLYQDLKKLKGE